MTYEQRTKLNEYDARDSRGDDLTESEFVEWEQLIALDLEERGI